MRLVVTIIALLVISGFLVMRYDRADLASGELKAEVESLVPRQDTETGFRKASEIIPFEFPKDHGPHPEWFEHSVRRAQRSTPVLRLAFQSCCDTDVRSGDRPACGWGARDFERIPGSAEHTHHLPLLDRCAVRSGP